MDTLREIKNVFKDTIRLMRMCFTEYRALMLKTAAVVLVTALAPFVYTYAISRIIDVLVGGAQTIAPIVPYLVLGIGAGALVAVGSTLQYCYKTVLYKELFQYFSCLIHERIAHMDVITHENARCKDLITKVQENAMWRAPDFVQRFSYLAQNFLEVLVAVGVLSIFEWWLGLLVLVCSLPRLWVDVRYNHMLWEAESEVAETRRKFWYARWYLVDLRALTEVKLFQNVPFFVNLVRKHLGKIKDAEVRVEYWHLYGSLITLAFSEVTVALGVIVLVARALEGQVKLGDLAFYLGTLAAFRIALGALSQNVGSQFRDAKFVRDMFEVFDMKPMARKLQSKPITRLEQIGEIAFDKVSFTYQNSDRLVLEDFSLRISGGSSLGIVAANGAGKSTLMKLLCRIYEPTSGRILVNGVDIREFEHEFWLSRLGILLQDFTSYEHLDLETIIRLGRTNNGVIPFSAVEEAARASGAHDFIASLPLGYNTTHGAVFDGGRDFSGGQRQRVANALVHFRDADISIFDEPTSAIDALSEGPMFEEILRVKPGKIRILISHRFANLRKANKIIVIENGRLVEQGTHDELMALSGMYSTSYRTQVAEYL